MQVPPFHWWRTILVLIPAISVYTIVLALVSLASTLVDRGGGIAHRCARVWSWLILATTGVDVRVEGADRLDRQRAYVFLANHQSIYDIPIIFASLPFQLRIIAKQSLGRMPFMGWHLSVTGHVLVDRSRANTSVLGRVAGLLRRGVSLIVFPEGTRSADGRVGRFRGGIFLLAIQAGRPIVPLSVIGSRHVMKKGRLMTCPGAVRLIVHEPIPTGGLQESDAKALADRVRRVVETPVHAALAG